MSEILLKDIIANNDEYLRLNQDTEALKKSIQAIGLINPLTINRKNELLAGGRRYSALKELGHERVSVNIVDRDSIEQELISIDENLVRKPLEKLALEKCLNRGREIYEKINPLAEKVSLETVKLSKEEEKKDETSFAAITAEKTGLSKSIIKNAIKRDALSSNIVKEARSSGELSASQVNELICLEKSQQEEILPHIKNKTVKEVKQVVRQLRENGIENAIEYSLEIEKPPKEVSDLLKTTNKINKELAKLLVEEISYEGKEQELLKTGLLKLQCNLTKYLGNNLPQGHEYLPTTTSSPSIESLQH